MTPPMVNVLGVSVTGHTINSLFGRLDEMVSGQMCSVAYYVNAHALNLAATHQAYRNALQNADVVYADGASILLAARLLGSPLPERLCTTDIWPLACEWAVRHGLRFFLLGGEPGLAALVGEKAAAKYPGLQIVGTHHGFFDLHDVSVIEMINESRPDVLWVGMGDPRQVLWVEAAKDRLDVPLVMTCGGMYKVITGALTRAPLGWRKRGFEWVYRIAQEPKVWGRYFLGLPLFGLRIIRQRFLSWLHGTVPNLERCTPTKGRDR